MKIFIIGCGRIFKKHIQSILFLKKKIKIVGIADNQSARLKSSAKLLKVDGFLDYKIGIKKTNPDLVVILTPSGKHAENILDVLKLKKNIIVEKPMCLKISEGLKIIKLSKKLKKKFLLSCKINLIYLF